MLIEDHDVDLLKVYKSFQSYENQVNLIENAEAILHQVIDLLELSANDFQSLTSSFINLVKAQHPENQYQSYQEFTNLFAVLAVSNNLKSYKSIQIARVFAETIEKSLRQYKILLKTAKDQDEANTIKKLIEIFSNKQKEGLKLSAQDSVSFSFRRDITVQEDKSIKDMFDFYTKQHVMVGRSATFEYIGENIDTIDSGSFLYFTKSFNLCSNKKIEGKRFLTRQEVIDIFKSCAQLQKSMNFQGFKNSLDEIATLLFNKEFDKLLSVPCSGLGPEEKRIMLYEYLKLNDAKYVHATMKPIGKVWSNSIDDGPRIPSDDPSRKYKYKATEETKEQLNQYKKDKEMKLKQVEEDVKKKVIKKKKEPAKITPPEEPKKRDALRMQDINSLSYQDLESGNLDELIVDSEEELY